MANTLDVEEVKLCEHGVDAVMLVQESRSVASHVEEPQRGYSGTTAGRKEEKQGYMIATGSHRSKPTCMHQRQIPVVDWRRSCVLRHYSRGKQQGCMADAMPYCTPE